MLVLGLVEIPWWALLAIAVICLMLYSARDFNYFKKQGIYTATPLPLIGTVYQIFGKTLAERDIENVAKFGDAGCIGGFMGSEPTLNVFDAEMLAEIMVKKFSLFTNRKVFKTGTTMNDLNLLALEDAHWKHVRNEMTPTFTSGKLKKMNDEVNRCARTFADNLLGQAKASGEVEIKEYAEGFTMDVIASTAFGIRVDSQKDKNNEFVEKARRAFVFKVTNPLILLVILFPSLANLFKNLGFNVDVYPKDVLDFFHNITIQTMEMRKSNDQSRSDFLQLMIKAQRGENINDEGDNKDETSKEPGTGLTTDEIVANAMIFFVAGYDTTATSLSFFMYNMALYPEVQERLLEEIQNVVGNKDFIETSLVQEMPYLDQCVLENLRLYPPAARMNRVAKEDVTIKNVFIRKGTMVGLPFFAIHMDPRKWPDPRKFDPERFSPENKKNRNPYHFLPFGCGPRVCIGMRLALLEMKVAIIQVLRKVKFSTCEKTQIPIQFLQDMVFIKAKGGIFLKVEERKPE